MVGSEKFDECAAGAVTIYWGGDDFSCWMQTMFERFEDLRHDEGVDLIGMIRTSMYFNACNALPALHSSAFMDSSTFDES